MKVRRTLWRRCGAMTLAATLLLMTGASAARAATVDLVGTWKAVAHCTSGWCTGQDFPATATITSFDPATGKFSGNYSGGALSGTLDPNTRKLVIHEGDASYNSDSVGTLSADGLHASGTWTDSHGVGGTYVWDLTGGTGKTVAPATAAPATVAPTTVAPTATTQPVSRPATTPISSKAPKRVTAFSTSTKRSGLLTIPNPGNAITLKNVGLAAAVTLALFALIAFPSTLFNHTLEANIDDIRRHLPKWMTSRDTPPQEAPAVQGFWQKPQGFFTFVVLAALLYSRMQPEFGANQATVHTFLGFVVGVLVSTMIGVTVSRRYLKSQLNAGGHLEVEVATLIFAAICVLVSRLANFVPGYFYGVIAMFVATVEPPKEHKGRMAAIATTVTFSVAVLAWVLMGPIDSLNKAGSLASGLLRSLDGGLFSGGVQALAIGLTPIKFLPGATLRAWNSKVWLGFYGAALFLFSLAMLHPGLADTTASSVTTTLVFCGVFTAVSVAFWNYYRVKAKEAVPATISE